MAKFEALLEPGNDVLLTLKPHLSVVQHVCKEFTQYKEQIQFRFTITSMNEANLKQWEPGAPSFYERFKALEHAYLMGYKTSISIEPILDRDLDDLERLVKTLLPLVTESIWLGLMNHVKNRVIVDSREIHNRFKNVPLIRFKDSITNIINNK